MRLTRLEARVRLDIDKGAPRPTLADLCGLCRRAGYRVVALSERRSPSGTGWHLTLDVSPRIGSQVEVVALQAILGSDVWREAATLSRVRVARGPKERKWANVLYAGKVARGRLLGGRHLRADIVAQER